MNEINASHVIDSGKVCIDKCPFEKIPVLMELKEEAVLKLRYLQDNYRHVEFLVYGNAIKDSDYVYHLDNIYIPEQKVGAASVDDVKAVGIFNTVIHKHPGNYPGNFSPTDEQSVNANHDFSILIGSLNLNNIKGNACIKVDCGRYMHVNLNVNVVIPATKDKSFTKETANIKVALEKQGILSKVFYGTRAHYCHRCSREIHEENGELVCNTCNIVYSKP